MGVKNEERTLPFNLEAERSVLGTLLVGAPWTDVCDVVQPEDFYRNAHRRIFEAMAALAERKVRPDFVTLREELARRGILDEVGGPAYVSSLADGVPRATNIAYYAGIVRGKATRRELIYAANRILEDAYEETHETADDALDAAERAVLAVGQRRGSGSEVVDTAALVAAGTALLERVVATGRSASGVTTGLAALDAETRGMHPGQLVVVAARPGEGKSTLMLNVMRHAAAERAVLCFSLEMSRDELGVRLMVAESHVDGHRLLSGTLPQRDYPLLAHGLCTLREANLLVDDTPYRSVGQIRSTARRFKASHAVGLVCIDYLGLVGTDRRRDKRHLELADVTRALKLLAKELDLPIMLLCQLNRESSRTARKPQLSDLAESGATEQDADQVWFIYHPPSHDDGDEDGVAELIVAKNRSGPTALVRVCHLAGQYRFCNLAAEYS